MNTKTSQYISSAVPARIHFSLFLTIFSFILISSCSEEPQIWKKDSRQQVIGDYVAGNPDQFSEFGKLIESTEMYGLLNVRGPFTLFLPTDEAMYSYYSLKNISSVTDLSEALQKELILSHIIPLKLASGDFGLGAIREPNANGDFVVTEFEGSDIIIAKACKIIDRDILAANGYIHVLDKVMDPITADIYTVVASDPSYKIFSDGLRLTGLSDTLQIISFPFGNKMARTRFTLLAVADTTYQRYGINNADDLIAWCGANPDSITFLNNPFYRYMEYHCLNESYYLSDLNTGIYPILSRDNNVSITISDDYKINMDNRTKKYTGFNIPASNTPAKNGAIHAINDILPVIIPEATEVLFETTDFFDLKQGDYYGNFYKRWFEGTNSFAKINWEGNYLLYYYQPNNTSIMNGDCLSTLGWWTISITFPKVMKGKYEVYVFQPSWSDVTDCVAYLDGERTDYTYTGPYGTGPGGLQQIADADFKTTAEHTITLRNTVNGMLFWDYVIFRPVK